MSTKVAAITMIKDECDIIELFVRINSRCVDHIYVIDHDSKDGTQEILLRLKAQGFPLTIYKHESSDFQQAIMLTTLCRQVAATNDYDYIVPLDADEFIHTPNGQDFRQALDEQVPKDGCGLMAWVTYVPTGGDYYGSKAPLYDVFRKRAKEPEQFYKVVIPNEPGKTCIIAEGSHFISVNNQWLQGPVITPVLQHVPVRSVDQITAKSLIGARRLSIKVGRSKTQTAHWDHMAEKIRAANYRLPHSEMLAMAFLYAGDLSQDCDHSAIDETAPRVGNPDDQILFADLSRINILMKFDQFAASLCGEIRATRGIKNEEA